MVETPIAISIKYFLTFSLHLFFFSKVPNKLLLVLVRHVLMLTDVSVVSLRMVFGSKATKSKAAAKIVFGNINTATQASATGTLKTTLSGGATSVVILCASGVTYSATADTMIGTTNLVKK